MTDQSDMDRERYGRWMKIVVVVACAVRLALLGYVSMNPGPFSFPDSDRYVRVARHIAAGDGPIDGETVLAGTDPVYPAMLAIGIRMGCDSDSGVMMFGRAINAACGVGVVLMVAALGVRLFSRRVGLFAGAWSAIDPILLFFNALALTELPYIAMLMGAVLLIAKYSDTRRLGFAMAAGVVFGIATLTRSSGLFLPILFAVWMVVACGREMKRRQAAMAGIVMLAGVLIVMSPVIHRNYSLFGAFVPVRTGSGASLMEALGPWADGGPGMDRIAYPHVVDDANEVERDRVYREAAVDWASAHPEETVRLAIRKLSRTWSITINADAFQSGFYAAIGWISVAPVFLLALIGIWRIRGKWRVLVLLLLPGAYFTLVHMVFVGSVRYRLPAMPFLFILAAIGLCASLRMPERSQSEQVH